MHPRGSRAPSLSEILLVLNARYARVAAPGRIVLPRSSIASNVLLALTYALIGHLTLALGKVAASNCGE